MFLLDTHVVLWSQLEPDRIGPTTAALLADSANARAVSSFSTLEIARLCSQGRLELALTPSEWVQSTRAALSASRLELTDEIAAEAYSLPPPIHRDPADRVLAATARLGALVLLTADRLLLRYPHVETLDATK